MSLLLQNLLFHFGQYLNETYNLGLLGNFLEDRKAIGLISMSLLSILIISKGAELGVKALYVVASVIFISLLLFFFGESQIELGTS